MTSDDALLIRPKKFSQNHPDLANVHWSLGEIDQLHDANCKASSFQAAPRNHCSLPINNLSK